MYYLYIIKNRSNKLYIGVSEDPEQRLREHNSQRGAQFTKNSFAFRIVFLESYNTLSEAREREIQLKKWSRYKKDILIVRYQNGLETKA